MKVVDVRATSVTVPLVQPVPLLVTVMVYVPAPPCVKGPESTIATGDCEGQFNYASNGIYLVGYSSFQYMPVHHAMGGNFGFCDGHVKWYNAYNIYMKASLWGSIKP